MFYLFVGVGIWASGAWAAPAKPLECQTTREFITACEFLKANPAFRLPLAEARDLALKIAEGCTGSANRFIRVARVLEKAGVGRRDQTKLGLQYASSGDAETDAFVGIFRKSLASDDLDLSLEDALKIALSLSYEFPGSVERARDDFEKLSGYCSNPSRMGLPKTLCGVFAARVAKMGANRERPIAADFIESFEFLKSSKGPALPRIDAARVAEEAVSAGNFGRENFIDAYRYAVSESGLGLPRDGALEFAKRLSLAGVKTEVKTEAAKQNPENAEVRSNH